MSAEESNTQAKSGAAATEAVGQTQTVDVEKTLAKVAELERDNKAQRDQIRALRASDEEKAKKAGEYEPLIKQRDDEIAELRRKVEAYEPVVAADRKRAEARAKAIAEAAAALSAEDRALVEMVSDLDAREKLVAKLSPKASDAAPSPRAVPKQGLPANNVKLNGDTGQRKGFSLFS